MDAQTRAHRALNRVTKWRVLFTGWQLGTRPKGDPEGDAVRDHREVSILLRTEVTALAGLLLSKGIFTQDEFYEALAREADFLSEAFERKFPGIKATDTGLTMTAEAEKTMRGWKP